MIKMIGYGIVHQKNYKNQQNRLLLLLFVAPYLWKKSNHIL